MGEYVSLGFWLLDSTNLGAWLLSSPRAAPAQWVSPRAHPLLTVSRTQQLEESLGKKINKLIRSYDSLVTLLPQLSTALKENSSFRLSRAWSALPASRHTEKSYHTCFPAQRGVGIQSVPVSHNILFTLAVGIVRGTVM